MFDYNDLEVRLALKKYKGQRLGAKSRGVDFLITFEEWYQWWLDSGHWHERGHDPDQYVMGRINDIGPYHIDNIICIPGRENFGKSEIVKYPSPNCLTCQYSKTNDFVSLGFNEESYRVPDRHCLKCDEFEFKTIEEKRADAVMIDIPDHIPKVRGKGKKPAKTKSNAEYQKAYRERQKLKNQNGETD